MSLTCHGRMADLDADPRYTEHRSQRWRGDSYVSSCPLEAPKWPKAD